MIQYNTEDEYKKALLELEKEKIDLEKARKKEEAERLAKEENERKKKEAERQRLKEKEKQKKALELQKKKAEERKQLEKDQKKQERLTKYQDSINLDGYKRHFIDISLGGGATINYNPAFEVQNILISERLMYVGNITMSFGYQYALSKYFACGVGVTVIIPVSGYGEVSYNYEYSTNYYGHVIFSGGALMFQIMAGDLYNKKVAFLFDIGGGWMGAAKIGISIKGFIIKAGFAFTGLPTEFGTLNNCNSISLEMGYKFNPR